jgi:type IV secretory pathway VirB2 component (pilin)
MTFPPGGDIFKFRFFRPLVHASACAYFNPQEFAMKYNYAHLSKTAQLLLLFGLTATLAFAQTSSFGTAAQGFATEMIAIAKWVGIILCIICGIGLMAGGPGTVAKVSGLVLGLVFALFASPIIAWVQAL